MQRKLAESARQYRIRAGHGDTDAQYHLGSAYYYGRGVPQDYAEAIRWYRRSAGQGIPKAQYAVGYCYLHGQGVHQDSAEAVRWVRRAAGQGYASAQCSLAASYAQGRGVPLNYSDAARWYRKAAEQGDEAAQLYLGHAYSSGQGVPKDSLEALRWRLKAVEQAAFHCIRSVGWAPWAAAMLALASFALAPFMVWGHARWLSWALMAGACATQVVHVVSGSFWSGLGRVLVIAIFTMLSAACALGAVMTAVRGTKPGVDRASHPR